MRLKDRIALVTGSSRGIGAAIAIRLAADGAKIIVHAGTNTQRGEKVVSQIRNAGGVADLLSGDLSERDTPARLVADAFAVHGSLDILVNNAAVSNYRLLVDHTADTVDFEIALNQRAVILASCEFARLTQSVHGRIINISSCAGHHSAYGRSIYSATKGAMESFTRSIAQELGERGITVNAVAPGTTVTDLFEENEKADTRDWRALFAKWTALRRVGEPGDIADIVAFIASDDARWLTGVTIPADGGLVTTGVNIATYAR